MISTCTHPEVSIEVEHCLYAASVGLTPFEVIESLGVDFSFILIPGTEPSWDDARLAVRIAARWLTQNRRIY